MRKILNVSFHPLKKSENQEIPVIPSSDSFLKLFWRLIRLLLLLLFGKRKGFWERNQITPTMKKFNLGTCILIASVVACGRTVSSKTGSTATNVTIDPSQTFGVWDGWGISLCWWANVFGNNNDILDLAFTVKSVSIAGTSLPGLGLNIARYNAGGSAWREAGNATMVASSNIPKFKQIEGFWQDWYSSDPSSSSWNWTVDATQVDALKGAHARGATYLELFSNSPMWWACYNHNPSGSSLGSTDNLQSWNNQNHAVYLATIAAHARDAWGLDFHSVEAVNEPISDWWKSSGTQEGCHFDHSTQATVLKFLRQELNNRNLSSISVSGSDENSYTQAIATWQSFDSDTKAAIQQVNVHGYEKAGGRRDLLYAAVHSDGKRLWNSEYGDGDGSGMSLASNLILDFKWLHNTAYVYWQLIDEAGGWGMLQGNMEKEEIVQVKDKHYIYAQFSRHIRPGMSIVKAGDENDSTVAAYDSKTKKLVIVAQCTLKETLVFDLSRFSSVVGPVTRWVTGGPAGEKYAKHTDVQLTGKSFQAQCEQHSLHTFELENITL